MDSAIFIFLLICTNIRTVKCKQQQDSCEIWHKVIFWYISCKRDFLVLNLFYRSKMVILFSKVPEGDSNFFQGAGSNCLFPIDNPYIL